MLEPIPIERARSVSAEPDLLVGRYSEIFLKGENRGAFEAVLEQNVRRALKDLDGFVVERHHARIIVQRVQPGADLDAALAKMKRVFGFSTVSRGIRCERDRDAMAQRGIVLIREAARMGAKSFKVFARRSDKRYPFTSPQLNDYIGQEIKDQVGLRVDLSRPDVTLTVEVGPEIAFVSTHRASGPGGLPVGVSGNVLLLLSGGIDSPLAGYMCQKRGCRVTALYFHSPPYTGEPAKQKVIELAQELGSAQGGIRLVVVRFTEIQELFRDKARPRQLVILYRRAMMRIASQIAELENGVALATGENLGQVASQTLENLRCIEETADRPILRPLLTYDKSEIMNMARKTGTYEISVRPHEDCCSLFVPKHPVTKGRPKDFAYAESKLPIEPLLEKAVAEREVIDIGD